jgi:hypothetical protein
LPLVEAKFLIRNDHVQLADAAFAQVQRRLGEIFEQVPKDVVLLLLVAQLVAVEADVLKHVLQLAEVGFLDGVQRLVDALAVAGGVAQRVQ